MNARIAIRKLSWGLGLAGGIVALAGEPKAGPSFRDTMRFKLHFAQGVLEGITTEKFPLVVTNSAKLAQLACSTEWKARTAPEYERFTADFIRHTAALGMAAQNRSVDAASVAHFQLTVSCVDCHRHLRGVETGQIDLPAPGPGAVVAAR